MEYKGIKDYISIINHSCRQSAAMRDFSLCVFLENEIDPYKRVVFFPFISY